MTRRGLAIWVAIILGYVVGLLFVGLMLSKWGTNTSGEPYKVFKDLMPLLLAIPAAWLGALFQKRASFLSGVQALYESALNSVHKAVEYTALRTPTKSDCDSAVREIEITMDLFRGTFKDVKQGNKHYYPFETLAMIRFSLTELGYGDKFEGEDRAAQAGHRFLEEWRSKLRPVILNELDRHVPSRADSWKMAGRSQTVKSAQVSVAILGRHGMDTADLEKIIEDNTNPLSWRRIRLRWMQLQKLYWLRRSRQLELSIERMENNMDASEI